jgi:hypothetical protein
MLADKDHNARVEGGRKVEQFVIDKLIKSGFNTTKASDSDDMIKKVDVWLKTKGEKVGIQIKFRETGNDILFEVFDTFYDFHDGRNKKGRDMIGEAKKYAVLINNKIVIVDKQEAKDVIEEMVQEARCNGWSKKGETSTLFYDDRGFELQLKMTRDHADGRRKMVAFIPKDYFKQSQTIAA